MNFLIDNPLTNLSGPMFLLLYGAIIFFSAIIFYLFRSNLDWTAKQPAPLIPQTLDPYEIAYLRGGENEFARALIFTLTQKGFLQIFRDGKKSHIALAKTQPNWTTLSQLERSILGWFQNTRRTSEVFESDGLTEILKPFSMTYEQKINQNHFLTPKDVKTQTQIFSYLILAAIAFLGLYKLLASIVHGSYNILFLIAFMVVSCFVFWFLGKTKRLSLRGKKYLESLQSAFEKLRDNPNIARQYYSSSMPILNTVDPMLLAMGIYGTSVLVGNGYTDFEMAFNKVSKDKEATSATSCSSGCGSSCGGGWFSSSSCGSGGSSCSSCSSGCGGGCGGGGD